MTTKLLVTAQWDDEAGVWVATSNDIPGLATEASTLDGLLARVLAVAPELMDENSHLLDQRPLHGETFDICIMSQFTLQTDHAA